VKVLRANSRPQELFLASTADIVIFGGGAGGGKTYAILYDTLRYVEDPNYRAVIFRRTSPMLTSPGGLWDTASQIYTLPGIDGIPKQKDLTYVFPSGATVKFSHMEHVSDMLAWKLKFDINFAEGAATGTAANGLAEIILAISLFVESTNHHAL